MTTERDTLPALCLWAASGVSGFRRGVGLDGLSQGFNGWSQTELGDNCCQSFTKPRLSLFELFFLLLTGSSSCYIAVQSAGYMLEQPFGITFRDAKRAEEAPG